MTPTHTDSPLRRSEIQGGIFRTPALQTPAINDDEEERRQARRRTILDESSTSSNIEDNETLKNCLKIYAENKISKDNAWSVSLIDTLANLLDKHHKSLNNFKVAGSSLEASSKVYGLRVDSIHTDVVRMSAGLHNKKVVENKSDDDDNEVNTNDANNDDVGLSEQRPKPAQKKRKRTQVSTITKNKETINGKLDTNPFTDPVFAKLNSIVGSINSSSRLLQNILPSCDSELRLRMDYKFWDYADSPELFILDNYDYNNCQTTEAKFLDEVSIENCLIRPTHTGYIITDTPAEDEDDMEKNQNSSCNILPESQDKNATQPSQMAMAFDINADVEPIASETQGFLDVDLGGLDDLTVEEQVAIGHCKGLRRAPVMIEDMRPIDSNSSKLEYSYRPLDKISQFWAGPSHWKFKRNRSKSLSIAQRFSQQHEQERHIKTQGQKMRRKPMKLRAQQVQFGDPHDDLFQKIEGKSKLPKVNIQKKWDCKKLKLPTDLQLDREVFDTFKYAPGIQVLQEVENAMSPDIAIESGYDYNNPVDQEYCTNSQTDDEYTDADAISLPNHANEDNEGITQNHSVFEIGSDFAGAPDKIIKVVVPYAKRAKVVDMKQLKKCCLQLINDQFLETENIPQSLGLANEKYKKGIASFQKVYKDLPNLLSKNMAESLSTSIAFYAILHLANETNLRLIQQDDLKDFQIRQLCYD